MDNNIATLLQKMNDLRKYYDKKSTLNCSHSEIIIDIFRTCVRKDKTLASALESDIEGYFDKREEESRMDVVETSTIQPRFMEVEGQSKIERLCSFTLLKTNFDAIFDGLETDGRNIANEFVDWESAGPLYSFDELRNALCGEAKNCFNALYIPAETLRKFGPPEQLIWWELIFEDILTIWKRY